MLPKVRSVKLPKNDFPTKWQTVIFRNYGLVSVDKIAKVLCCNELTVTAEAKRLGLDGVEYDKNWESRGYITIIRNNWFLLPYGQLIQLLGITEETLGFWLEKEDFLSVKLGGYKPDCEEIKYTPLTEDEKRKTALIADMVRAFKKKESVSSFDFFPLKQQDAGVPAQANGMRIVHGYLTPCGDVFSVKNETHLPDVLLNEYQKKGVNGLWIHGLLSTLSPYPFGQSFDERYRSRRDELKSLVARCKKYGIKVYLYLNEPRGISENKFGKYADLIGRKEDGVGTLCLEKGETQAYLYEAIRDLVSEMKDLGGFITITMSENPTHCNYRPNTNCPTCKNIPPEESAAKVNNIIMQAIRDVGSDAELIANLWGWSSFMDWTEEQTLRGVELLDKDISVMCVSEYDLDIRKGGVKSRIIDYSISNPGPSAITKKTLKKAAETGHKLYAKIQINNSWECAVVPYLPTFDLTFRHLQNLAEIGVEDYMMTWTLGGYPSPTMDLVAEFSEKKERFHIEKWYEKIYGEYGEAVHEAVKQFCEGFEEYPFSIDSLYYSPKTLGAANLWESEMSEKQSSMVCFSYDDYENWIKPYPYEIYISQYKKLLKRWGQGLDELKKLPETPKIGELKIYAETAYLHFYCDYLQTQYSYYKRNANERERLYKILSEAEKLTKRLLGLISRSAFIGYETSNHYFYNERNLMEKLLNLNSLRISMS